MSMHDKDDYWICDKCGEIYYWVNLTSCPVCEPKKQKKYVNLDDLIDTINAEFKDKKAR